MMNFDYILWVQSDDSTKDDTLLVDGKPVDDENRHVYFSFISLYSDKKHIWKPLFGNARTKKKNTSLRVFKDNNGYLLITSHYRECDNRGRLIVYAFCLKGMDLKYACMQLKHASSQIQRTISPVDEQILMKKKDNRKNLYIVIGIFIFIIIVIWLIIKSCNLQERLFM